MYIVLDGYMFFVGKEYMHNNCASTIRKVTLAQLSKYLIVMLNVDFVIIVWHCRNSLYGPLYMNVK